MQKFSDFGLLGLLLFSVAQNQNAPSKGIWEGLKKDGREISILTKENPSPGIQGFEAALSGSGVNLQWTAKASKPGTQLVLERSANGVVFEEVSRVSVSHVLDTEEFMETDFYPYPGLSFYRLKQIDESGIEHLSDLVAIKTGAAKGDLYTVDAVRPETAVSSPDFGGQEVLVVVLDASGKEVFSKIWLKEAGTERLAIDPNHNLAPGSYTITACSKQKYYSARLTIR